LICGRSARGSAASIALDLPPFRKRAGDKYRSLGLPDRASELQPLSKARMAELTNAAAISRP
jgi:hypothetical protein